MDKKVVLIAAIGGIFAILLGGSLVLQAASFVWMASRVGQEPDFSDILEQYVDEQIEAGAAGLQVDPGDPLLHQRKILLANTVNAVTAKHVVSKLMYLNEVDPTKPIDLYLLTQGGYGDSAFAIIDAMRLIEAPVNTWAIGGCYSAGAMILAAGTGSRYSSDNAVIMVHTNLDDSSEPYTYDRLDRARYEKLWRGTASLPEEWFPMTDDGRYYLSPKEAVVLGVIDEIVSGAGDQ